MNNAPIAQNGEAKFDEGIIYTGQLLASDPDGDSVIYSLVGEGPVHGTVSIESNGSYTYEPESGYHGTDSFIFTARDSQGATSAPATVSLTINAVNSPPSAFGDSASFDEDTSYTGSFLAADIEGNPVTFAVETGPTNGTVVVNGDGTYTYTPDADYFGTDSFTFTATDSEGGVSSPATIALTVNNTADDPIADDGLAMLNQDTTYNGTLSGSDPDGTAVTYAQYLGPMYGSVTINSDGTYSYTPMADYSGLDSFTFMVTDGDGAVSNVATVTLDINSVPTSYDASATLDEDTPYSGTLMASDVEGDPMTFAVATGPAHGMVMVDPSTGEYTYTPDANYYGTDSFSFSVTDTLGATSNTATIDLTINEVPLAATSGDDVLIGDATDDALVMAQSGTTVPSGTLGGTDSFDGGDGVDSLTLGNLNQVTGYFDAVNFTAHLWGWADVGDANPDDPYQLYSADAAAQATVTFSNLEEIYFESYDGTTDAHYPTNFSLGDPFVGMLVAGGAGADWINWNGSSNEGWFATADGTVIFGGGGDDVIFGSDGDDDIYGGADNDTIYGGDGYNSLSGGAGNDTIYAEGYFDNVISGDDGDDTIIISGGTAYHDVDGGLGTDSLALSAGSDMVVVYDVETITDSGGDDSVGAATLFTTGNSVDLGSGTDALALAEGVNTLTISNVETVTGTMGNDTLNLESTISGTSIDLGNRHRQPGSGRRRQLDDGEQHRIDHRRHRRRQRDRGHAVHDGQQCRSRRWQRLPLPRRRCQYPVDFRRRIHLHDGRGRHPDPRGRDHRRRVRLHDRQRHPGPGRRRQLVDRPPGRVDRRRHRQRRRDLRRGGGRRLGRSRHRHGQPDPVRQFGHDHDQQRRNGHRHRRRRRGDRGHAVHLGQQRRSRQRHRCPILGDRHQHADDFQRREHLGDNGGRHPDPRGRDHRGDDGSGNRHRQPDPGRRHQPAYGKPGRNDHRRDR